MNQKLFHYYCFRKYAAQESFGVMFNYEIYFYFTSTKQTGHKNFEGQPEVRAHGCHPINWKAKAAGSVHGQLMP